MPIDFPTNPAINDIITRGSKKYIWTGEQWAANNTAGFNVVDSPTIDLDWNASTRTLSADVPLIPYALIFG